MQQKLTQRTLLELKDSLEEKVKDRTVKLEEAKSVAETMARTDVLTGLNNRRSFYEKANEILKTVIRKKQSISALMIDADNFKELNDTYSHSFGDKVLKKIANNIFASIREIDLCARIGGEEFVVLMPDENIEMAQIVAQRILSNISKKSLEFDGQEVQVTVSIGVSACKDTSSVTIDKIIKHADLALYKAKKRGKNCINVA